MEENQLRWHLKKLKLPQTEFSDLFGINRRTGRRYVLDELPVPPLLAAHVRMMAHSPRQRRLVEAYVRAAVKEAMREQMGGDDE